MLGARRALKPQESGLSGMLRLTKGRARAVFFLFTLTNAVNAAATASEVRHAAVALVAFVLVTAAAALLLAPAPDVYPARLTALVVGLAVGAAGAAWNVPASGDDPGWSAWFWGAAATVLLFLALRGRVGAAWIGMGLLAAVAVVWALTTGQTVWQGGAYVIRHAAMLLVGTFFALYLLNTARSIERVQQAGLARARSQEGSRAAAEEGQRRLERLRALADPALRLLASDAPLTERDRQDFRLLEATLRDWLRGDALATEPVLAAARAARERGVDVTILDDGGNAPLEPSLAGRMERAVVDALEAQGSGDIVIRRLPVDRPVAMTIRGSVNGRLNRLDIPRDALPQGVEATR